MQSDSLSATEEETTIVNLGYIKVISLFPGIPFPNIYRYSFSSYLFFTSKLLG